MVDQILFVQCAFPEVRPDVLNSPLLFRKSSARHEQGMDTPEVRTGLLNVAPGRHHGLPICQCWVDRFSLGNFSWRIHEELVQGIQAHNKTDVLHLAFVPGDGGRGGLRDHPRIVGHHCLNVIGDGIKENALTLKLLTFLVKKEILMTTIVGMSELVWNRPCLGSKLERGIHGTKAMVVAREGRLEHDRVLDNGLNERGLVLSGEVSIESKLTDNVIHRLY